MKKKTYCDRKYYSLIRHHGYNSIMLHRISFRYKLIIPKLITFLIVQWSSCPEKRNILSELSTAECKDYKDAIYMHTISWTKVHDIYPTRDLSDFTQPTTAADLILSDVSEARLCRYTPRYEMRGVTWRQQHCRSTSINLQTQRLTNVNPNSFID